MKKVILVVAVIVCFYSCHKDDESGSGEETTSSYLPMAVGNYWVYQEYLSQGDGTFVPSSILDSTYISKDTLINGKTFYKFDNYQIIKTSAKSVSFEGSEFYSDSVKYLIDSNGVILFSENNFTDILYKRSDVIDGDTLTWITGKMEKVDQILTVPAGTFTDVLNLKGTVNTNLKVPNISNPRYVNKLYAKNVGKVLQSFVFVHSGGTIERRLVRYKINQ